MLVKDINVFSKLGTHDKDIYLMVEKRILIAMPLRILLFLDYFYINTIKV